jgi:hypothetical protein
MCKFGKIVFGRIGSWSENILLNLLSCPWNIYLFIYFIYLFIYIFLGGGGRGGEGRGGLLFRWTRASLRQNLLLRVVSLSTVWVGDNVVIFVKYFRGKFVFPKIFWLKTLLFYDKNDHNIDFRKIANFSRRTIVPNNQKSYFNFDPWFT